MKSDPFKRTIRSASMVLTFLRFQFLFDLFFKIIIVQWRTHLQCRVNIFQIVLVNRCTEKGFISITPGFERSSRLPVYRMWRYQFIVFPLRITAITTLSLMRGIIYHISAYRIQFNITHIGEQILLIMYERGFRTTLPHPAIWWHKYN